MVAAQWTMRVTRVDSISQSDADTPHRSAKRNVARVGCNGVDHPLRCPHLFKIARHHRLRDLLVVTAKAVGMRKVVAEPLYADYGLTADGLAAQARADVRMVNAEGVSPTSLTWWCCRPTGAWSTRRPSTVRSSASSDRIFSLRVKIRRGSSRR